MRRFFLILIILVSAGMIQAQDIRLPRPQKEGGMPLMEALNNRRSVREISEEPLSLQILSDLLWAAEGVNREDGRRTAPSAMNMQEIDIYVYTPEAVYLYLPREHLLKHILDGDYRDETVRQPFAKKAPVILLYVANYQRMQRLDQQQKDFYGATDTGFISQNVYLFCAQAGLNTVVLGMIDRDAAKNRLGFDGKAQLGQPVGYPIHH
ncbi:MAG: SagB/ThcOx family dehydrogenase [Bacteroidales bacterium]|jgi:SagB-type dehydrogenase family enzyme|nr:SagB/ThcOx family dehydrogenase [Bacteroidales bacterium]MDD2264971.1 SagB/ThcOx family dehydrogenase [Bacteroidales bacterium]MDD2832139.1 SagB/ThcOx family dehydrogenase [Bacteroidales bacterium]MDD3208791.1 SagB/ThcOx family dehydrogenase [Bacteroidales bacterium]MDD3697354.1 SagB/ThcOx family dehydrogenase [Bacteroidales bacterium]